MLIFPNHKGDLNPVKINIANFNVTYFKPNNLALTNSVIDNNNQVVLLKSFPDMPKALVYFNAFGADTSQDILGAISKEYDYFFITKANYSLFYQNKDIEGYKKFFTENY